MRKKIKKSLESKRTNKKIAPKDSYQQPIYDDIYFEGVEQMEKDDWCQDF